MRKTVMFAVGALMFTSFAGAALADAGGVPNSNAGFGGPGSDNANGRKANCVVPGSVFKTTAKDPGPNNDPFATGQSPGQVVSTECTPNPS